MLGPLSQLLKRLIKSKSCKAYIACTHRNAESISKFLGHLDENGLHYSLALKTTCFQNNLVAHEPLHAISIFEIADK